MKEYTIKISRYNPELDREPIVKEYIAPHVEQGTVLEALLYIYEEIDSELLFNYGCRYKACGKCAIRIDGKPRLACETPLRDGMLLEPLENLPVIRDLAVDRSVLMEPLRRHQIIFNQGQGREIAVQPPEFFQVMKCNECLSCLSNCPVFAKKVEYDGPFFGLKLAELYYDERDGGDRINQLDSYLDQCILCKRCDADCPWDVNFSEISTKIKGALYKRKRSSLRDWILSNPSFIGYFQTALFPISNALMRRRSGRKLLNHFLGIDEKVFLPEYHPERIGSSKGKKAKGRRKAAYFLGCYNKFNDSIPARDSIAVMEANRVDVEVVDFGCCGLPLIGLGNLESAGKKADAISEKLRNWISDGYDVVLSCSSCGSMIKVEYPTLFGLLKEEDVQSKIYNIGGYLLKMHKLGLLDMSFKETSKEVGYHIACHLKAQKIGIPFIDLLNLIPGLKIRKTFDECCGMAGTTGFKKEKYELSRIVGNSLITEIGTSGLDLMVTDCASCQMKIRSEAEIETIHPISVLKRSIK